MSVEKKLGGTISGITLTMINKYGDEIESGKAVKQDTDVNYGVRLAGNDEIPFGIARSDSSTSGSLLLVAPFKGSQVISASFSGVPIVGEEVISGVNGKLVSTASGGIGTILSSSTIKGDVLL